MNVYIVVIFMTLSGQLHTPEGWMPYLTKGAVACEEMKVRSEAFFLKQNLPDRHFLSCETADSQKEALEKATKRLKEAT